MQRRTVLRGLGVSLAVPFLSSLREVRGEEVMPPKRLVIFHTPNGCITDKWWPALEHGALAADTFDGTTLDVLQPFYRKLLLPRGLRSMNAYAVGQTIDPNDQAMGSKLTCAPISATQPRYATAESLDHTIAKQVNPNAASPLVLSVGQPSTSIKEVLSFSAPHTAFPAIVNPQTVYASLTGLGRPGGDEPDYRRPRGESVIDLVREDLERLRQRKLSSSDSRQLQTWLDLLRDTEVGMDAACTLETAERLGITSATLQAATPTQGSDGKADLATAFTRTSDMMMNLMALSMLCDANRSLLLTYPGYVTFDWDGIHHTRDHSALSNRTGDGSIGGTCMPNVLELLLEIDRFYARKFARLVGLFDAVEDGHGTLLDNTATLWLPQFSDGAARNLNNLPILIAGSAGGYLRQGAAVNVEGSPIGLGNSSQGCGAGEARVPTGSDGGNVPINKLYVTLMNAVGCTADGTSHGEKVTHFGQFDGLTVDSGVSNPGEVAALVNH